MFTFITAKSITAVAAAALAAGLAVFLTSVSPQASAEPQVKAPLHQPYIKGDRLPSRVTGAACSQRAWPDYDRACEFDRRRPADPVRAVRVIALR